MAANEKVIGRAAYNHVRIVDIKTRKHRTYSTRRLPNDVTVRPTIKLYGFSLSWSLSCSRSSHSVDCSDKEQGTQTSCLFSG